MNENANRDAKAIVGKIIWHNLKEFPGCDFFGLDPDNPRDKLVSAAIIRGMGAAEEFDESGDNSWAFGYLEALLELELVSTWDVIQALSCLQIGNHIIKGRP